MGKAVLSVQTPHDKDCDAPQICARVLGSSSFGGDRGSGMWGKSASGAEQLVGVGDARVSSYREWILSYLNAPATIAAPPIIGAPRARSCSDITGTWKLGDGESLVLITDIDVGGDGCRFAGLSSDQVEYGTVDGASITGHSNKYADVQGTFQGSDTIQMSDGSKWTRES